MGNIILSISCPYPPSDPVASPSITSQTSLPLTRVVIVATVNLSPHVVVDPPFRETIVLSQTIC
jgi:hypothetical protein